MEPDKKADQKYSTWFVDGIHLLLETKGFNGLGLF